MEWLKYFVSFEWIFTNEEDEQTKFKYIARIIFLLLVWGLIYLLMMLQSLSHQVDVVNERLNSAQYRFYKSVESLNAQQTAQELHLRHQSKEIKMFLNLSKSYQDSGRARGRRWDVYQDSLENANRLWYKAFNEEQKEKQLNKESKK